MKKALLVIGLLVLFAGLFLAGRLGYLKGLTSEISNKTDELNESLEGVVNVNNPLTIDYLRKVETPGSDIVIEEELPPGSNYDRYVASYTSEGLKIYGLLTIPQGQKPATGWPVVLFNHGYIPPREYVTTERYIAYTDAFSNNGYVLFRPDYRGHGNSEGQASGGYGNNGYTIDVLNAFASIKRLQKPVGETAKLLNVSNGPLIDTNRMGMWGHSMGGYITLRSMVVNKEIKAGVIWAGVVASYPDLINEWRRGSVTAVPSMAPTGGARRWRDTLRSEFGEPSEESAFWRSISANFYLQDISGPVQLHHGTADSSVPVEFSRKLNKQLTDANKTVEYYEYPGDDHNISQNFSAAINRSVVFFDTYVKAQ